ncbi:TadE family type IV pilus minor pilin [Parenemella sanctibonifatiensis]|uniref:Uncharacterized protein n=1 Tax=Parenemella sanctibonifatiensis TaxID=2016505 RepID=A0A255EM57_9ACTN|nr:TadE family type IV pilus minor pilin [Parenemella sanctibonifatiensis]OYN92639.1 hypothetical protein CGZ91_03975 [Parenemella sanctibonifatiensis]
MTIRTPPNATRPSATRGRDQRGMVTAELALGTLALAIVMVLLGCLLRIVFIQIDLTTTATEVARQYARGDEVTAQRAARDRPAGAAVDLERGAGEVVVVVSMAVPLLPGTEILPVPISATARVPVEPGVS